MGRQKFALAVVTAVLLAALPVGKAEAQTFRNCRAVRAKYPNGVTINFARVGTSGAEINRVIYLRNQRLDRDKDGLICEDESKQIAVTTTLTTVPASTATSSTTTTARVQITRPTRVPFTIPTRVPFTIPTREPITMPTRVPITIPRIVIPPSAALCRVLPTTAGCESLTTTTTTTTTTTSTTTTVYRPTLTPLGQPVTTSSGLVVTVSNVQQSDPGSQWNFFFFEFDVSATYPADSPNTLSHLQLGFFYVGCKSVPRSTWEIWDWLVSQPRPLAPLAADEIAGRVRKGTTQQLRVRAVLRTADEVEGTKIDWSNHRYLALIDISGTGLCPGNFPGPIFELPFVLNPKS